MDKPPKKQDDASEDKDFTFPSLHEPEAEPAAPEQPAAVEIPAAVSGAAFSEKARNWIESHKSAALVIAFVVIAGAMWGISALRSDDVDDDSTPEISNVDQIPVNVMEARFGRFQDFIDAVGSLKGEVEIELRFEVEGTVAEFSVMEGAKVSAGQIIARLNDRDAKLKVQRARIELEQMEKLYSLGGVSKTKLDEARLNMDVAQSELDKTRIVASRGGILGERDVEVGEFVNPQRKVAKLVSIKNVVVEAGIIEKQVDKVYPGQKILVNIDAYPGNVFEGKIETISPIIGSDGSKTFSVRAKIPNPDSLLLPGMFSRSRIITYEADDAISIPNDALVKTAGGYQVLTVNKDGVAEARDVEIGYVATEATQITAGLNPGETVIVQRPPELKPGSKVKIIEIQKQNQ